MTTLRVFEIAQSTDPTSRPAPKEKEGGVIAAEGDAAKRAARELLQGNGYIVRSMNWAPNENPTKPPVLVAYVELKRESK